MKPYRLIHLFQHITDRTPCPHCKSHIAASNIRVNETTDQSAFLTIHCDKCTTDLQAHVFVNLADIQGAQTVEQHQADILPEEIRFTQDFLRDYEGGLSELFPQQHSQTPQV